jgi:hypothetical protein
LRGKIGLQLAIDLLLGLKLFQWQALFGTFVESVRSANRTDCSARADWDGRTGRGSRRARRFKG